MKLQVALLLTLTAGPAVAADQLTLDRAQYYDLAGREQFAGYFMTEDGSESGFIQLSCGRGNYYVSITRPLPADTARGSHSTGTMTIASAAAEPFAFEGGVFNGNAAGFGVTIKSVETYEALLAAFESGPLLTFTFVPYEGQTPLSYDFTLTVPDQDAVKAAMAAYRTHCEMG